MNPSDKPATSPSAMKFPALQTIIKHDRVRVDDGLEPAAALPNATRTASERASARCRKSIELLRVQGAVQAIQVRCSCGEVSVIEIEY